MFTGIITGIGSVIGTGQRNDVRRLTIACKMDIADLGIGASIACNGICMTIVTRESDGVGQTVFEVDAGPETIDVTTVSAWDTGTRLNLEKPVKLGEELSGHLISGHIDGLAEVVERADLGETTRFTFAAPPALARFIAAKGSVALDGTSLTVNAVDGARFECMLIPHTLQVTTWNERKIGDKVNLEVDLIARYVSRLMEGAPATLPAVAPAIV
jgi:riboflavin synthase